MDAVELPEFCVVEETRAPPLRWLRGGGGGIVSRSLSGVALVWEGCPGVVPGCLEARTPWRAPVAGARSRSRRRAVSHQIPEGQRSLPFLRTLLGRSRRAPVVVMRPPHPLCLAVLQLRWGTPSCTGPVGRLAGARVRDQCPRAPRARGGPMGGLSPHPLRRPLVNQRFPWPCVRGVLSSRQRSGRQPWEAGGG